MSDFKNPLGVSKYALLMLVQKCEFLTDATPISAFNCTCGRFMNLAAHRISLCHHSHHPPSLWATGAAAGLADASTAEVVEKIVKPETLAKRCSWAELHQTQDDPYNKREQAVHVVFPLPVPVPLPRNN